MDTARCIVKRAEVWKYKVNPQKLDVIHRVTLQQVFNFATAPQQEK